MELSVSRLSLLQTYELNDDFLSLKYCIEVTLEIK